MEKKKAKIEVKPVSWTDGNVNKYQAVGSFGGKNIFGDPQPTKEAAMESLSEELSVWGNAVSMIMQEL